MRSVIKYIPLLIGVLGLNGCQTQNQEPDAYGKFEATTFNINPEVGGKLITLKLDEGKKYQAGEAVGWTDTTQLYLRKQQLKAQKANAATKLEQIQAQMAVHQARINKLNQELDRFRDLLNTGGATQKQVDDLDNELKLAKRKKKATASKISEVKARMTTIQRQIAKTTDKISNCRITFPQAGTVLQQLKEQGEVVRTGGVIARIAKVDTLKFNGFITGTQLSKVELGEKVTVRIDKTDDSFKRFPGRITWIADEAEFSPKNIKTKKERSNLVYALEVKVKNEGQLKIGMPGEVVFE